MREIKMPKLSDTMEEGKILRWLKQVGDRVAVGEILAEVETDKADMELEAVEAGILREIRVREGESAAVGEVLALLDEAPEERAGAEAAEGEVRPEGEGAAPPPAAREAESEPAAGRVSPLARRIAREQGVDLREVRGTGPAGRVVRADLAPEGAAAEPAAVRPAGAAAQAEALPLSRMRLAIAQRMAQAKREVPHFYVTAEIEMSQAMRMLESLRRRTDQKISVTHLVLKAVALALAEHPRVNGRWADGAVVLGSEVNIGLAVAVEDGLILPVLHGCERRSLFEIAREATRLVARAKEGKFSGEELRGATFSVSNLGMLDIEEFAAVITPPQAAVLAVGAVKERPVVRAGRIEVGRTMRVTLSCDHRQLNGVEAGRFLETLKGFLEEPISLLLA